MRVGGVSAGPSVGAAAQLHGGTCSPACGARELCARVLRKPWLAQGFQRQTARWPVQPLQAAAEYLRAHSKRCVVADFGCGDAQLAALAPQETVHSLDLVAARPGVIACNMAHTPLGAQAQNPKT